MPEGVFFSNSRGPRVSTYDSSSTGTLPAFWCPSRLGGALAAERCIPPGVDKTATLVRPSLACLGFLELATQALVWRVEDFWTPCATCTPSPNGKSGVLPRFDQRLGGHRELHPPASRWHPGERWPTPGNSEKPAPTDSTGKCAPVWLDLAGSDRIGQGPVADPGKAETRQGEVASLFQKAGRDVGAHPDSPGSTVTLRGSQAGQRVVPGGRSLGTEQVHLLPFLRLGTDRVAKSAWTSPTTIYTFPSSRSTSASPSRGCSPILHPPWRPPPQLLDLRQDYGCCGCPGQVIFCAPDLHYLDDLRPRNRNTATWALARAAFLVLLQRLGTSGHPREVGPLPFPNGGLRGIQFCRSATEGY